MWLPVRLLCCAISPVLVLGGRVECSKTSVPRFSFTAQRVPEVPRHFAYADATITVRETAGKPLPICPCVKQETNGQCINYDSRYLAVNLEEAIVEFPDLTALRVPSKSGALEEVDNSLSGKSTGQLPRDHFLPTQLARSFETHYRVVEPSLPKIQGRCKNMECLFCTDLLTRRLMDMGLLDRDNFDSVRQRLGMDQLAEIQRLGWRVPCKQFRFAAMYNDIATFTQQMKRWNVDFNSTFTSILKNMSQAGLNTWNEEGNSSNGQQGRRRRRDTLPADPGTRYKLDCVRRGEPVDSTEWLGLCNICWVWRRLPPDYFPQYVNELICDEDTKCLSGWGKCKQRERSMDVLRNIGTAEEPIWKAVTINTASFCDCFVQHGTVMHTFIAA